MREERMRELMQQEMAVPEKVHEGFEKGIAQVVNMDMERADTAQKAGRKGGRLFWRRAGLVAAAVAAVCVMAFHSQIYSFAKSLFIRDVIKIGDEAIQETNTNIIKIKDGVLTDNKNHYFESLEDVGEKLGVSFLKSSVENDVAVKGRVSAQMLDNGQVEVTDYYFVTKDISQICYTEDDGISCQIDSDEAYSIRCEANFYTKAFRDDYEREWMHSTVIEEYETANGFHATLFRYGNSPALCAIVYCDNIWYEYEVSNYQVNDFDTETYTVEDFKAFLDTLTK